MNDDLWIFAGSAKTTDAKDKEPVVMHAPAGNMFWADDQSGQNLDIQFAVNGKKSPSLPKEFTPKATLIPNSLEDTCNSLELYVNGQNFTLLENMPTEALKAPGDLRAAILTCPLQTSRGKSLIRPNDNGNEVLSIIKASDSLVLPPNSMGEVYNIDDMAEEVISALFDTLAENSLLEFYEHLQNSNRDQNAMATAMTQTVEHGLAYAYYKSKYGTAAAKGYLKELIFQGKFTIKKMTQWGGKLGVVFKGERTNRTFLTGINYGIHNDKMKMLSSAIQMTDDIKSANIGSVVKNSIRNANPFKGTNSISFIFVASFDLYEFFKKDVGEKNIAELFGALGITTAKLFLSGVITAVLLGALLVSLSAVGVVLSASLLLLSIAGLSFAVGWSVDSIDSYLGLKDRVKRTLKDAFPHLTIENMIQKEIDFHEGKVNSYIGSSAMQGSGFYGF